jgi:hypothetical protein
VSRRDAGPKRRAEHYAYRTVAPAPYEPDEVRQIVDSAVMGPPAAGGVTLTVNGTIIPTGPIEPAEIINSSTSAVSNANPLLNNAFVVNQNSAINGAGGILVLTSVNNAASITTKNLKNTSTSFAEVNCQGGPGTDNLTMIMTNSNWAAGAVPLGGIVGVPAGQCGIIGGINGTVGALPVAIISNGAVQAMVNSAGLTAAPTVAPAAGGSAACGVLASSTASLGIFFGTGAPTFSAAQGSIYSNTTGAAGARLYVNTNGSTTWAPASSP